MIDFELISTTRVRVRGEITQTMFDAMTTPGAEVKSLKEAEFPLDDYIAVCDAAPPGKRIIPNPVLKTVLSLDAEEAIWNELLSDKRAEKVWRKQIAPLLSAKMRDEFKPHQRIGVVKAIYAERYMIADDMGLGKTASAIACIMWLFAQPAAKKPRVLVICPPKLRVQWSRELAKWTEGAIRGVVRTSPGDLPSEPVPGSESEESEDEESEEEEEEEQEKASECEVTIVGYTAASNPACADLFVELCGDDKPAWDFVVMDETHDFIGSDTTRTSKYLVLDPGAVALRAERLLMLTGSASGPKKLFTQMMALFPTRESPKKSFELCMSVLEYETHYCGGHLDAGTKQWDNTGVTHAEELHTWFSRRMVRRMKDKELKGQLPEHTTEIVRLPVSEPQLVEYRRLEKARAHAMAQAARGDRGAQMRVKNLTNEMFKALTRAKMPACKAWIAEHATRLWDEHQQKTVVFTHYDEARKDLALTFKKNTVVVSGTTAEKTRIDRIDSLASQQNTDARLGLLSNKACCSGITLAPAVTMAVVVEQDHSEAVDAQLKDRIYRIGAVHPCRIVYLLAEGPHGERLMDSSVFDKVDTKFENTSAVVEGAGRKRKIDKITHVDLSGVHGSGKLQNEWGVRLAKQIKTDPLAGESFDAFLDRVGVRGSLSDAFVSNLVEATAATVALAAGDPVKSSASAWYQVPLGCDTSAAAGRVAWMDAVEVCILTSEAAKDNQNIQKIFTGESRMRLIAQEQCAAALFVRRQGRPRSS